MKPVLLHENPSIPDELLRQLKEFGNKITPESGQILVREAEQVRAIPIVLEGSIKVMEAQEDGRELLLYYILPGESCIMSFMAGIHHESSRVRAIVEGKSEILLIPIEIIPQLLQKSPQWLDYLFRLYHKRFEELLDTVNALTFKKTDERLMDLLHKKAELTQNETLFITHEQLALELGTVRVVISRILKHLEEEGKLKMGRNKITLV